jgi:Raf kinase inhibitor-like YbhB/YbcL family protein
MGTRRTILDAGSSTITLAPAGSLGGGDGGTRRPTTDGGTDLTITSPAFADGESIPTAHTCDGADRSPALRIAGVPDAAVSLALVVDDPDAPGSDPFTHWLLWNVSPATTEIPADRPATATLDTPGDAVQGANDFGDHGYRGPCPPAGHGPHTYRFRLSALDTRPDLNAGADRRALLSALDGHRLASATLTGEYERED